MGGTGRGCWVAGGLFGLTGVAAGAFGAHALRAMLSPAMLAVYETAVRYQMYHALALLGIALAMRAGGSRALRLAGGAFVVGVVVFSGSLYLLTLTGARWWGAVTPVGGVALLIGWSALIYAGASARAAA